MSFENVEYETFFRPGVAGVQVPGISLSSKVVTLKGFNGLQNGVTIDSFDLPADDPSGGIQLTIQSTVTNVSKF